MQRINIAMLRSTGLERISEARCMCTPQVASISFTRQGREVVKLEYGDGMDIQQRSCADIPGLAAAGESVLCMPCGGAVDGVFSYVLPVQATIPQAVGRLLNEDAKVGRVLLDTFAKTCLCVSCIVAKH